MVTIYTSAAREAARERRRRSKEAMGRWRASGFGDGDAFQEFLDAIEATNAERRAS